MSQEYTNNHSLAISTIFICLILIIHIISSHVIELKKAKYIHESVVSIFLGIITAIIIRQITDQYIVFDHQLFFSIILPPIIFSAGYHLRKRYFLQNLYQILFYGVIGTIMTFTVISSFALVLNEWNWLNHRLQIKEILLYSAVLSATDTVSVLNLVKESKDPFLYSILFGEGIINDAIAIVIYRSVYNYKGESDEELTFYSLIWISLDFVYLLFFSVLIGTVYGLGVSFFFKKFDSYSNFPMREISFILLFAYIAYLTSELLGLSGIISLFVCGILMGNYAFQNLSQNAQMGTHLIFESVGYLAEAFVLVYLGVTIISINFSVTPFLFSFVMIIVIMFARFITVFSLPCIAFIIRRDIGIQINQLKLVWFSGLIRGAIAFALSLQINCKNPSDSEMLKNSVLLIVIFTIVIMSSCLQSFQRHVGLELNEQQEQIQNSMIDKQKTEQLSSYNNIGNYNQSTNSKIQQKLTKFEENYVRPLFTKSQDQKIIEIDLKDFSSPDNKNINK